MKRVIAFALAAILSLFTLVSCKGNGEQADTGSADNTVGESVSLTDYTIVRLDTATENEKAAATALRLGLADKGITVKVANDSTVTDKSDASCEILIGNLGREQTKTVLSSLDGAYWAIEKIGNKIVVVSPFDILLSDAVEYFLSELVSDDGNFTLTDKKVSELYGSVILVDNDTPVYRVIVESGAPKSIVSQTDEIADMMGVMSVLDTIAVRTYNSDTKDLILGNTCITESVLEERNIGNDGYGYVKRENKLLVLGTTDATTSLAISLFKSKLQTLNNADGTKDIAMIYDAPVIEKASDYYLDYPRPDSLALKGNMDCGNNNIELIYSGATQEKFSAYCSKLASGGYTLYGSNEIGNNKYATYTGNGGILHTYFNSSDSTLRIISARLDGTALYPVSTQSYTKVTDSTVALLSLSYNENTANSNNGMIMVFTLEDGSYLIFDGGETNDHADRLYNYLKTNNKRSDKKIVIAGWVLTHAHTDHYGGFLKFVTKYAKEVSVEYIFANGYAADGVSCKLDGAITKTVQGYGNKFAGGETKIVKVHTGQKLALRNAQIDILLTHEDFYPTVIADANDTSVVAMVKIDGKKILMTADAHTEANKLLVANFGSELKCDILQVPHHGQGGMTQALASAASPKYAFYATGNDGWLNYKNSVVNKHLISIVGSNNIYIADGNNTVMTLKSL
ncbi:MAG: MBL fold metallo-hydrolase [Clostridia bacterium]|nr:MBL fold metallo-hydrolase [Clostridia bacterium]